MTAAKVVDASAIGALLFGEPAADAVAEVLAGARLIAPALLPFEVTNIAAMKMRRHPDARAAIAAAHALLAGMAITIVAVDQDDILKLAHARNLTAYDASDLWLARELGAGLVTLDKALDRAAHAG